MGISGISALSTSVLGFDRAQTQLAASAESLSGAASASGGFDIVDLSSQMLSLIDARNTAALSAAVAHTAQEMDKNLFTVFR